MINSPIVVSVESSDEITSSSEHLIGVDPYVMPAFPISWFNGGLTIEPIITSNLIVDSNVLSPSSYGPSAVTLDAQSCNSTGSSLTSMWAYIGDLNAEKDHIPGKAGDLTPGDIYHTQRNEGSCFQYHKGLRPD